MNRYAKPENFGSRIRTPLLRKHFVYRAYDVDGQLLYVGCTSDLESRMSQHRFGADWYGDMDRLVVVGPHNYETARLIEYNAIETERALHNHSTERRELRRLSSRLFDQHVARLMRAGVDHEAAGRAALDFIDTYLPEGRGRGAVAIDDTTLPRARRFVADHRQERVA